MDKSNDSYISESDNTDMYKGRLLVALKAAKMCVFEVDLRNRSYTFFENAEDIFGVSGNSILEDIERFSKLDNELYMHAVMDYFVHPDDHELLKNAYVSIVEGKQNTFLARMRLQELSYKWCKIDLVPVMEGDRAVRMIGVITDISDAKQMRDKLEQKSNLDGFTGLYNKEYSRSTIRNAISNEPDKQHALLIFDIDYFKNFNDNYGHLEGDKVIAETAKKLSAAFRKEDLVGRFGGDEFIVFVRDIKNLDWVYYCANGMTRIEADKYISTNSVGIAVYPKDGSNFEELFKSADKALYKAKEKRQSAVFYKKES